MRIFLLVLIAANLLLFGVWHGYFSDGEEGGREPQRLANQVAPENMKVLPRLPPESAGDASSSPGPEDVPLALAPAPVAACLELGGFSADEVKRAQSALAALALGSRLIPRRTEEQSGFVVYLPPLRTRPDADRAVAELRRLGVSDFFIIQDNSPLRLGVSLGVFSTQAAAMARLNALSQQGVRGARIGERRTTTAKTWFQVRGVDADLRARLEKIRDGFPNHELRACTAG